MALLKALKSRIRKCYNIEDLPIQTLHHYYPKKRRNTIRQCHESINTIHELDTRSSSKKDKYIQAKLPYKYWSHAFQTAVYLINRLPTPILDFLLLMKNYLPKNQITTN